MPMPPTFGPAADQDATEAYLFTNGGRYAVSRDRSGENLPKADGDGPWQLVEEVAVGVHEPLPVPGDPEPVLRGLLENGFYVWSTGGSAHGTSQ